jgi:hypothetical protein
MVAAGVVEVGSQVAATTLALMLLLMMLLLPEMGLLEIMGPVVVVVAFGAEHISHSGTNLWFI